MFLTAVRGRLLVSIVAAVALGSTTGSLAPVPAAAAAAPSRATVRHLGHPRGVVPRVGASLKTQNQAGTNPYCTGTGQCSPPLNFATATPVGGGLTGTPGHVTITPVYWAPTGYSFTTNYKSIINQYIADIAHDSGQPTNVFSPSVQYYQNLGSGNQFIQYAITQGAEVDLTDTFPPLYNAVTATTGCTPDVTPVTYSWCVSDTGLQNELSARLAPGSMTDANIYMVMFPRSTVTGDSVETCMGAGAASSTNQCSSNVYCAYHSSLFKGPSSNDYLLYANEPMPFINGSHQSGCNSPDVGIQAPNGDSYADILLSSFSHEANETITDWAGAWFDANGFEDGDECGYVYGASGGTTGVSTDGLAAGTKYNQVINGHHYFTQDEFSNSDFATNTGTIVADGNNATVYGCVQVASGAHFQVTASTTTPTAGTAFNLTVTALNPNNTTNTGYVGTVHFTSSDAQAVLPANYTFTGGDAGVHTFTSGGTLKTAGAQTITATDTVTASNSGVADFTVSPGQVHTFLFNSLPAKVGQGQGFTFGLTAKDAFGNAETGYTGTVHFTSSDGSAVLPANYTFGAGENGVHTGFASALGTRGSQTITATDTLVPSSASTSSAVAVEYVYYFTWYDHASDINFATGVDELHAVNVGGGTANIHIHIPGIPACDLNDTLAVGSHKSWSCSTGFGGPVVMLSDQSLDASQRVKYSGSFNETKAQQGSVAVGALAFTWFDHISDPAFAAGLDDVHVFNPGALPASVNVHIPGFPACDINGFSIPAATDHIFQCSTGFGGPVTVNVTNGQQVIGSQRVKYGSSFNETAAHPTSPGATNLVYTWYDRISDPGFTSDDIHVFNPGGSTATVNIHIPGFPACDYSGVSVPANADVFRSCSTGFGGPVTVNVTSGPAVIGSQRVKYYSSFNETAAVSTGAGGAVQTFPYFDATSAGVNGDNIHVVNPGASTASITVHIPGCADQVDTVGAGAEKYYTCATGQGGPATVTVTSGPNVIAGQRVKYYQSFNEVAAF